MKTSLPSVLQAKGQAKRLGAKMTDEGAPVGHAKSLELIAHQFGFHDWNTMLAAVGNSPPTALRIGDLIRGAYLSQPFTAHLVSVTALKPGWFRLALHLDEAVDVVTSVGFSNFRTRVYGIVGPNGHSVERTSNGETHIKIDLW